MKSKESYKSDDLASDNFINDNKANNKTDEHSVNEIDSGALDNMTPGKDKQSVSGKINPNSVSGDMDDDMLDDVLDEDMLDDELPEKRHHVKDLLDSLVIAFVIAMVIRTFLFSAYKIPSGSMISTLLIGDNLIASKISYMIGKPKFGDIAVFEYPVDPRVDYIKRVIGVPGDTIEIVNKQIYRNGVKLDEKYARFESSSSYRADYVSKFIVPAGHYFMLGDNRDASSDSRYWGFVPESSFKAKSMIIYWSREPGSGFKGIRYDRLLKRTK